MMNGWQTVPAIVKQAGHYVESDGSKRCMSEERKLVRNRLICLACGGKFRVIK